MKKNFFCGGGCVVCKVAQASRLRRRETGRGAIEADVRIWNLTMIWDIYENDAGGMQSMRLVDDSALVPLCMHMGWVESHDGGACRPQNH